MLSENPNDVNSMIVNDLWAVSEWRFGSFFSCQSSCRYCLWSIDHGFNLTQVCVLSCFIYAGQKVLVRAFWQIWSQRRWNALVCTPWIRHNTIQEGNGVLAPESWRCVDMYLYLWFRNKWFKGPWRGVILRSRIPHPAVKHVKWPLDSISLSDLNQLYVFLFTFVSIMQVSVMQPQY